VVDWGVVCLLAAYCWVQWSVSAGYGQPLPCATVLQSMPVSCHFRGCKVPLSRIVSGAISSELPLPFTNGKPRLYGVPFASLESLWPGIWQT